MGKFTLAAVTFALMVLASEATLRSLYPLPPTWLGPQTTHLHSPLLRGWVLPPGSRSFALDAPVCVNSLGLRDDEIPREKSAGETRILCLGDSFSFALGVRFEDLYVQQLERRLTRDGAPRRFQAINAAVAGYNTRQELIYLLTDGLTFEPDLISVGFYWHDLVGNEAAMPDLASTPRLAELWTPTGFPFVDLEPSYRAALNRGDNPFLPYDLHPSVVRMEIAADALYQEIRERGYLGFEKRGAP